MPTPLEEARELRRQMRLQTAKTLRMEMRGEIDNETGAPGDVRAVVGGLSDPRDQLATLRQRYPDARIDPVHEGNFLFTNPATGRLTRYNPPGFDRGDLPSLAREGAQLAGGTVGAVLGLPAGLAGAVAGSGLGTAAGEELFNTAIRVFGGASDRRDLAERSLEAGTVGALGAAGEAGGALLGAGLRAGTKALFRGGTSRRLVQEAIDDLAPSGANPTVAQATQSSTLDSLESTLANFPGAKTVMRDFAERTSQKVNDQIQTLASRAAGTPARRLDPEFAGQAVRQGVKGFVDRRQEVAQGLYAQLRKEIPIDRPVNVKNTIEVFADLSDELIPPARIVQLQRALQNRLSPEGEVDFGRLLRFRSEIGSKIGKPELVSDIPRASMKRLYGAISRDIEAAARQQGPEALKTFRRANDYYRGLLSRVDNTLEPLVRNRVPERVFKALETGGKDGATALRAIRKSLTEKERRIIAGTTIRRLGRETPGRAVEGDEFSFQRFLTNWNSLDDVAKDELFQGLGTLRADLDKIARASRRLRQTSGAFANPSGTAQQVASNAAFFTPGLLLTGLWQIPLAYAASGTVARGTAKLLTSPRFVSWLAKGTEVTPRGAGAHIGRLAGIAAGSDAETKIAIKDYLDQLQQHIPEREPRTKRTTGLEQ